VGRPHRKGTAARPIALTGEELYSTLAELVRRVATAAELSSGEISDPDRMGRTACLLGRRLGLDEERCELLRLASPLHDIGKLVQTPQLPHKAGPLTAAERRAMEAHTESGHALLAGSGSELLELAASIALTHHERWDGGGYPRRLAREEIPLEGRIASVADVFDALMSDRAFRPAFPKERALRMMQEGRGTLFDPLVLDAFVDSLDGIFAIYALAEAAPPRRAPADDRRWRRRRAESPAVLVDDLVSPLVLTAAVDRAVQALDSAQDDRQAIDAALTTLCDETGPELLASIYVVEHDRLWLVSQRGYEQVRDGFPLDQGIMSRALTTRATQLVANAAADPDFVAATRGLRSELALPLGDGIGVLNLETRRLALTDDAIPAARRLADAVTPRAAALRSDLGFDLASLARLFVYASSLRGAGTIAEFATRTLARLLRLESAQLSLGREETGFALASFWCRPESDLQPLTGAEVEQIARAAGRGDAACSVVDLHDAGLADVDAARRWLVWLPLEVGGDHIGVLVGGAAGPINLDHEHVEAATLFAPHAAALIDVAQTLRREQRAAVTDPLTGLLNRRGFEQRFREEIERAERAQRELAVIIVDCDGLKEINDRGGHELGDTVLLLVARCLKTYKRSGDVAARLGGDEFALLLPEIDAEGAVAAAERLRRSLVDQVLEDGQLVTATFGIAAYPSDGATPSDLMRAADQALYAAKQTGRNRTELYARTVVSG
jgi:diguanylate cyclase (GGDEF)-like protein